MAEEVELLVSEGAARVVETSAELVSANMTEDVKRMYVDCEEASHLGQVQVYREGRKKQIESMVGRIVSGRGRNDGKGRTDHEKSVQNHEKDEGSIIKEQLAKVKDISRESALVQSFMENPFTTLPLSHASTTLDIGASRLQQCRKLAFFDLWRRGFFLTDGSKFGADFLAYPGDPIRYHAQNIVLCLESHNEVERMRKKAAENDLVGRCRLGTAVNKRVLFAYVLVGKNKKGVIKYLALRWTGK